jgi:hypothetical protein
MWIAIPAGVRSRAIDSQWQTSYNAVIESRQTGLDAMAKSKVTKRKKPGPPPTGQTPVIGLRLKPEIATQIDEWAGKHGIANRSDAIRKMIDNALKSCHEARA